MYEVIMNRSARFYNKEYAFKTKGDCNNFLEEVVNAGCYEDIISVTKYNKNSFRNAWNDFFN